MKQNANIVLRESNDIQEAGSCNTYRDYREIQKRKHYKPTS